MEGYDYLRRPVAMLPRKKPVWAIEVTLSFIKILDRKQQTKPTASNKEETMCFKNVKNVSLTIIWTKLVPIEDHIYLA